MMAGRYVLDTNIIIALFDQDTSVIEQINEASEIYLPAIVIGELYYGAYNSNRLNQNLERIDTFRTQISILECDDDTGKIYGRIKKGLKDIGRPIPENDIWIAAIAIQHHLVLATRDGHFEYVEELEIEDWA